MSAPANCKANLSHDWREDGNNTGNLYWQRARPCESPFWPSKIHLLGLPLFLQLCRYSIRASGLNTLDSVETFKHEHSLAWRHWTSHMHDEPTILFTCRHDRRGGTLCAPGISQSDAAPACCAADQRKQFKWTRVSHFPCSHSKKEVKEVLGPRKSLFAVGLQP